MRGKRGDDFFQEPLDRYQPLQCRIRFRPGAQQLREFPRSSLAQLRDPPEEFSIGLGKFTDRVARAERESGPIDEPTLGQVVIRCLRERTRLGLQRARANGRIGGGRYKLSTTQQAEAIKMIRVGEKSQAEIAELFNVDRSTISRMMKEVREKELLKAAR